MVFENLLNRFKIPEYEKCRTESAEYFSKGDLSNALLMIDKSLSLNSEDLTSWWFKGLYLFHLNQYREASDPLKRAISGKGLYPEDLDEARIVYSICLFKLGNIEKAREIYSQTNAVNRGTYVSALVASNYPYLEEYDKTHVLKHEHEAHILKNVDTINSLDEIIPFDNFIGVHIYAHLGFAVQFIGQNEKGLELLNKALINRAERNFLDKLPFGEPWDTAKVWDLIGKLHNKMGQKQKALDAFNNSLNLKYDVYVEKRRNDLLK